ASLARETPFSSRSICRATTRLNAPASHPAEQTLLLEEVVEIRTDVISFHGVIVSIRMKPLEKIFRTQRWNTGEFEVPHVAGNDEACTSSLRGGGLQRVFPIAHSPAKHFLNRGGACAMHGQMYQ